jgi:hypothetical protein
MYRSGQVKKGLSQRPTFETRFIAAIFSEAYATRQKGLRLTHVSE